MKGKYRITTFLIMGIICIVVVFSYLISYEKIENIYGKQTYEVIFDLKKSFIKDTVNNLISEIDAKRQIKANNYKKNVDRRYKELVAHAYLSKDEFIDYLINRFEGELTPGLWTVFVWNNYDNKTIYDPKNLYEEKIDLTVEKIKDKMASYAVVNHEDASLIFGVSKEYIDENVKLEVIEKIRNFKFYNDSYIWINEVINYDGGKDYAIRRVHPNLPETEGIYLSTDMTDVEGNLPYLEELEGVNKNGEIFFTYFFKKLNSDTVSEKLTYAKLYKDYDWIIAMGAHLDDMHASIDKANRESKELTTEFTIKLILYLIATLIFFFILLTLLEKRNFIASTRLLESEVNQDSLTKAFSRRCGTKELITSFKQHKMSGQGPAIMIFDIDNFKTINDKYGHDFGDQVLIEIVQAVNTMIRSSDKIIRWGGDEFVGIFYGLKEEHVLELGQKILSSATTIKLLKDKEVISPTISIGFSYFKEYDEDFNAALKRADEALYKSKIEGKNRVNMII